MCDNFCIGVKFGRMPIKDLLIFVGTIPENLKVFGQLSPEFDTDKRKGKNNTLRFPVKNHDRVPYTKPISAMQLALVTKVKKLLKAKRGEMWLL